MISFFIISPHDFLWQLHNNYYGNKPISLDLLQELVWLVQGEHQCKTIIKGIASVPKHFSLLDMQTETKNVCSNHNRSHLWQNQWKMWKCIRDMQHSRLTTAVYPHSWRHSYGDDLTTFFWKRTASATHSMQGVSSEHLPFKSVESCYFPSLSSFSCFSSQPTQLHDYIATEGGVGLPVIYTSVLSAFVLEHASEMLLIYCNTEGIIINLVWVQIESELTFITYLGFVIAYLLAVLLLTYSCCLYAFVHCHWRPQYWGWNIWLKKTVFTSAINIEL